MTTQLPIKGMRDLYPAKYAGITRLRDAWTNIGYSYGYQEYEAPMLESEELYRRKSGAELVEQQSFGLVDRKGRKMLLRPEMTPGLARMIVRKDTELVFPLRWQSFGQFFRYEKPQRGRTRSFYQWNIDLIGSDSPVADMEMLQIACMSLSALGLTPQDVAIKISNRAFLSRIFTEQVGIPDNLTNSVFSILDKLDKIGPENVVQGLSEVGLSGIQSEKLIGFLDTGDWNLSPWFEDLQVRLKDLGIADWFRIDLRVIRGLGYYTGLVFEAWAKTGLSRAIFGGGRYDNLTTLVGGNRLLPAVGFAVGDVGIMNLLQDLGLEQSRARIQPEILVTVFNPTLESDSIRVAARLRQSGIRAVLYPDADKNLSKQVDFARRAGIRTVAFIGPDEAAKGVVRIKTMDDGSQITGMIADLVSMIRLF